MKYSRLGSRDLVESPCLSIEKAEEDHIDGPLMCEYWSQRVALRGKLGLLEHSLLNTMTLEYMEW